MDEKDKKIQTTPLFKSLNRPPREHISKEEFLRRLRTIGEWREKRLAELRAELRAAGEDPR
jgi:hypothetical protein